LSLTCRLGAPRAAIGFRRQPNSAALLIYVFVAGISIVLSGCGKKVGTEITTPSGLKYVDEVIGTGDRARLGRTISVHYTGTLLNGSKFDSSLDRGQPYEFRLGTGAVIPGWDEGILGMQVGGKRKLIVPPELGYGAQAQNKIPANSTLVFEVELLSVK
jgi:FKBP-type peptidyl-prolyl cis-trans isomerase FkpA